MRLVHALHSVAAMLAPLATLAFIASPAAATEPTFAPPSMTMSSIAPAGDPDTDYDVDPGYGAQILAADAAGIAMLLVGASADSEALAWAGLLTMGFGPGVVHATHGRSEAAIASMLLRPAVTFGAGFAGVMLEDCSGHDHDLCGLGGALLGGLVGYGAIAVYDAAYLARTKKSPRTARITPSVAASSSGFQVGIGGSF